MWVLSFFNLFPLSFWSFFIYQAWSLSIFSFHGSANNFFNIGYILKDLLFLVMNKYRGVVCVNLSAGSHRCHWIPQELELQGFVNHLTWVLGAPLGPLQEH